LPLVSDESLSKLSISRFDQQLMRMRPPACRPTWLA
jgi:hypothetical protein